MRKILCILTLCLWSIRIFAVMASPEPFEYTKPDGTIVMAKMYGDEFHSYIQSLDGELLEGSMEPAIFKRAAQRRRVAHAAGNSAFPTKGSPRSIVILVGFADLPFGEKQSDFQDLLTKSGYNHNGATGSCRDYYIASSDSLFSPQFDCYGPFTLAQKMEYYGGNSGENHSVHAHEMVAEACQMAHDAGVNFKDYDVNNDGLLDNVFIFFAGHNEAEGGGSNTIWPHASSIVNLNVRLDGVLVGSYACTSEYKGSAGKARCGIGTFCHEFGHVIGQPDFYDTDYNLYTVGAWDIMCQRSYKNNGNTPPTLSAYERMYEGWLKPKQLVLPGQYTLSDIPFKKEAYLIADKTHNLSGSSPNPNEFFLLDYRSGANVWDAYLPGNGMIVWHIDYLASAWTSNTPNNGPTLLRMHLEEANGIGWKQRSEGERGRDSDPYPGTQNVTTFTPTLHNGTQLAQPVFNIEEKGGVISFVYISKGGTTLKTDVEEIELTTTMSDKKQVVDWEAKAFELIGTGLDPNEPIVLTSQNSLLTLCAGDTAPNRLADAWQNSISLYANADSTIQQNVWCNFLPKKRNCSPTQTTINIASPSASIALPVIGYSPRPTYVQTPKPLANKNITPNSFTARWKTQDDAEMYYLTLYQIEDGQTQYTQSFEDFDDMQSIRSQGWQSNTTLTTASAKADGTRSLYIKNHGDQIVSETYPAPVTSISFWYNAFASTIDTIGVLELEAYNGTEWVMVERIIMSNKAKRVTDTREFELTDNYIAFRLTWMDNGASGIAFDYFVATTSQKITYLFKGKELSLLPNDEKGVSSYQFSGLAPNSTYYYQVQCTDLDKGCEEHLTDLSEAVPATTINGEAPDSKRLTIALDSINYNPAEHAIYLSTPEEGDCLYFYNASGNLVYSMPVIENTFIYTLPLRKFERGEVFLVQHAKNGKLGRKNKWAKFLY